SRFAGVARGAAGGDGDEQCHREQRSSHAIERTSFGAGADRATPASEWSRLPREGIGSRRHASSLRIVGPRKMRRCQVDQPATEPREPPRENIEARIDDALFAKL